MNKCLNIRLPRLTRLPRLARLALALVAVLPFDCTDD